jgi:hypothetical protein
MARYFLYPVVLVLLLASRSPAQSISSFTPLYAAFGDPNQIQIFGTGFTPNGGPDDLIVTFNVVRDTTATAPQSTKILANVPAGAPVGSGFITVQINGGAAVSSAAEFYVVGTGPYVHDFSPGSAGSAGGTLITLNGEHLTGVTSVTFANKNGTSITHPSDLILKVNTPAGVTSGPLTVNAASGVFTAVTNFYVPPVITGFSPTNGRTGTNVTITGTNFLDATTVRFGSIPASFTVLSNNAISVAVPLNAVTATLVVIAPAGSSTTTSNFIVQPTLAGFSPAVGPAGTSVTVTGANFNVGTPTVKFNGVNAAAVSNVTFSSLKAVVPATATAGPITVTTTNGTATSSTFFYLPPSITSFTPTNSAPGTVVKITGNHLTNASAVSFNGTLAAAVYVTNDTTVGAVVPSGLATGPITVTTPGGSVGSGTARFYGPVSIISFAPTHGLPGTNVVLTGSNFLGATFVRFNGSNASFVAPSNNTTLVATVPGGAQTGLITVGAPGGTNISASNFVLDFNSDLAVTMTDFPDPAVVGKTILYNITITNAGPFDAPNLMFTNTLPGSVLLTGASSTQGALATNSNPITGNLGTLTAGSQISISLTVSPQALGAITNTASVSSDRNDPAPANNTISQITTVLGVPSLSISRLSAAQVRVIWPVVYTNFAVQFRTNLLTGAWSNVLTVPTISGTNNVLTDSSSGIRFYRLKQ